MILVSTGLINFGEVTFGENDSKTFTIFNNANYDVDIIVASSQASFTTTPISVSIGANNSTLITVKFEPDDEATYSETLTISHNDVGDPGDKSVTVEGEGIKSIIEVSETTLDFEKVSVEDSKVMTFKITNLSEKANLKVTDIVSDNSKFSISPTSFTLSTEAERTVSVTFSPDSAASETGTLTIFNNSSNDDEVGLDVQGEGVTPIIGVDKTSIDYGNITINDTETEVVTVTNSSADEINLLLTNISTDNTKFIKNKTTATLAKDETLEINITFKPTDTSTQNGKLIIENNAGVNKEVDLTGKGTATPNIRLASDSVYFGKVGLGDITNKPLKIYNIGSIDLNISSVVSDNAKFTVSPSTLVISPSTNQDITISYNPDIPAEDSGTITITSDDPDSPEKEIEITGTGVTPTIETEEELDFRIIAINDTKKQFLHIKNSGETDLVVSNITVSDTNFFIEDLTYPIEINRGATKNISVGFHPIVSGNIDNAILTVFSNDYVNPEQEVILKGQSVDLNVKVSPDNAKIDYGMVAIGGSSVSNFEIKNLGTINLNITDVIPSISIEDVISVNHTTSTILPNEADSFNVTFEPLAESTYSGKLTVKSNAADIIVDISGEGKYAEITVDRSPIVFQSISPGEDTTETINISNPSEAELIVNLSTTSPFELNSGSYFIAAGGNQDVEITFDPTTIGLFQFPLHFVTNVLAPDDEFDIDLEGTALDQANLVVIPETVNFGEVQKGKSKTKNAKLQNKGTKTLTYTATVDGDFSVSPASGSVLAGEEKLLSVVFAPPKDVLGDVTAGSIEETLYITSPESIITDHSVALKAEVENSDIKWSSINMADNPTYKGIKEVTGIIGDILPPVIAALEVVNAILEIVKKLLIGKQDLFKIIVEEFIALVEAFVEDFSGTGLYSLFMLPDDYVIYKSMKADLKNAQSKDAEGNLIDPSALERFKLVNDYFDAVKYGSQVFKNKIINSFDDLSDSRRPQFSEDAYVGGVIFAIDSEDPSEFVENMLKLISFFRKTFRANYNPPTNVAALSGNDSIKLTFSPNTEGLLPSDYLIFRSETNGGDMVSVADGTKVEDGETDDDKNSDNYGKLIPVRRDMDGNILKSYEYIGTTNFAESLRQRNNLSISEADNVFERNQFRLENVMEAIGEPNGTAKFFYKDKISDDDKDKSFYYVLMSANVVKNQTVVGPLHYWEIVSWRDPSDGNKVVEPKLDRESTHIKIFGDLSNEVVGTMSNNFVADSDGLARCRNYRCTNVKSPKEPYRSDPLTAADIALPALKITLEGVPKTSSLDIKVERKQKATGVGGSEVIRKRKFTVSFADYRIDGKTIVFLKKSFFAGDEVVIDYEYYEDPTSTGGFDQNKESSTEGLQSVFLNNKPLDTSFTPIITPRVGNIKYSKIINADIGEIEVDVRYLDSTPSISSDIALFDVNYQYYDLEKATHFKCIDSVLNVNYFDKATCYDGTTQCEGYVDANCIFNDGISCSNTGISTRKIITFTEPVIDSWSVKVLSEEHDIEQTGKVTIFLKNLPVDTDKEISLYPTYVASSARLLSQDTGELELIVDSVPITKIIEVTYCFDDPTQENVSDPHKIKQQVVSEDIPFANFWDSAACQNGSMAQRCDGYSKVLPLGELKGLYPDWNAIRIGDILPLEELVGVLADFLRSLVAGTEKLSDALITFIELIQKKIEYIQGILQKIQDLIALLDIIFFDAGIHLLNIPTSKGGNEYLKSTIANADGGPSSSIEGFTGGVMITWGSANYGNVAIKTGELFKKLFGISDD